MGVWGAPLGFLVSETNLFYYRVPSDGPRVGRPPQRRRIDSSDIRAATKADKRIGQA